MVKLNYYFKFFLKKGRPSSPELYNLLNEGREGGICALSANIFLTHKLVGMALYNCDAYSGASGKVN